MNGGVASDDDFVGFTVPQPYPPEDVVGSVDTADPIVEDQVDSVDLLGFKAAVTEAENGIGHHSGKDVTDLLSSDSEQVEQLVPITPSPVDPFADQHVELSPAEPAMQQPTRVESLFDGQIAPSPVDPFADQPIELAPIDLSMQQPTPLESLSLPFDDPITPSPVDPFAEQPTELPLVGSAMHQPEPVESLSQPFETVEEEPVILATPPVIAQELQSAVFQGDNPKLCEPKTLHQHRLQQSEPDPEEADLVDEPLSDEDAVLLDVILSDDSPPVANDPSPGPALLTSEGQELEHVSEHVEGIVLPVTKVDEMVEDIDHDVSSGVAPENIAPSWASAAMSPVAQKTAMDSIPLEASSKAVELAPIEPTEFVSAIEQDATPNCDSEAIILELQAAVQLYLEEKEKAIEQAQKAEARAHQAELRVHELEGVVTAKEVVEKELHSSQAALNSAMNDRENLLKELDKLREDRDEHERKQIVLSNRLNAAKKREAEKVNLAESLSDSVTVLKHELETAQIALKGMTSTKERQEEELKKSSNDSELRIKKLETLLGEERRLNEDRKKKMKAFVENKQEEVRETKSQNDELNMELAQTNRSLREHHARWKQLHAQWVQSQTRNRELQRDINRMKMESENMSRMGDQMNVKLSQRAQETETHKNKRLTAKQELMTVLETLEAEREVSSKLQDSIKFTFTPKALSQQQILKENLRDFEHELVRLSQRLGKPLPPSHDTPAETFALHNDDDEGESDSSSVAKRSRSQIDANHLLSNLEDETQRVSQCIMALSANIDRLHVMIAQSGERTCATLLSDLLAGATAARRDEDSNDETVPRHGLGNNRRYGQVPTDND